MTQPPSELTFRDLAEAEPVVGVYAGLPEDRFLTALKYGRVSVDFSTIPEADRRAVHAEVVALIRRRTVELRNG